MRMWAQRHGPAPPAFMQLCDDWAWMKRGFLPHGPATRDHDPRYLEALGAVDDEVEKLLEEYRQRKMDEARDATSWRGRAAGGVRGGKSRSGYVPTWARGEDS